MADRPMKRAAGLAVAVALVSGSMAWGQLTFSSPYTPGDPGVPATVLFSGAGAITPSSLLFQRPNQAGTELSPLPPTTLAAGLFRYETQTFTVPEDAVYEVYSAQAFDGYLFLYSSFDPNNPLNNVLAGDDDMTTLNGGVVPNRGGVPGASDSGFRLPLLSGPTYTLVTTTFTANTVPTNGAFYNEVRTVPIPPGPPTPRFPIPDSVGGVPGAPVTIDLTLDTPGTISDFVSVTVRGFEHTWLGDLVLTLEHVESGTKVDLVDRLGRLANSGFGNSIDVRGDYTFVDGGPAFPTTGTLLPPGTYGLFPNGTAGQSSNGLGTLSSFNGLSIAGTWRLTVQDFAGGDTGFISAFSITLFAATTPSYVLGDLNFDGLLDAGDIDNFISALLESDPFADFIAAYGADFTAQYGGTLTAEILISMADFDDNGVFDAGDIDGFVDAVLNSGSRPGATVIPEPGGLAVLLAGTALLGRRRR